MTVRADLEGWLRPVLPKTWTIIPYADQTDRLERVTVILNQITIAHAPEVPGGAHMVTFEALVIEPSTDPARREDSLDDAVDNVLHALDDLPNLRWTEATKVGWGDPVSNIAYRINLEVLSGKDPE